MKELAPGVLGLRSFPPNSINMYVIEDVLIDASTRYAKRSILKQTAGVKLSAHALTHAHPDHQGASHAICEELSIPYWVGADDADAAEDPTLIGARQPRHPIAQFFYKTCTGPGHPVDRKLAEGDLVAGFEVIEVPGHSAGHVAFWRESDGVLIVGDVLCNMDTPDRDPWPAPAQELLHPRPGDQSRVGQATRSSRAPARALRSRRAAARHAQVRRLLRRAVARPTPACAQSRSVTTATTSEPPSQACVSL